MSREEREERFTVLQQQDEPWMSIWCGTCELVDDDDGIAVANRIARVNRVQSGLRRSRALQSWSYRIGDSKSCRYRAICLRQQSTAWFGFDTLRIYSWLKTSSVCDCPRGFQTIYRREKIKNSSFIKWEKIVSYINNYDPY